MKRILIVAEYFAPNNEIAAVRVTKLAKYFKLKGYSVGVISRKLRFYESIDPTLQRDLKYVDEHIVVSDSWLMQKISKFFNKQRSLGVPKKSTIHQTFFLHRMVNNMLMWLFSLLKRKILFTFHETRNYSKKAKKQVKKISSHYEVILTSSGPFSANILGYVAKRNNPNILWIADFRDPLINSFPYKKYLSYYKKIQKKIIEKTDIVTGVSDFCVENFKDNFNRKIAIICNGFDDDDISNIEVMPGEKFTLTYAGTLYSGKRDLSIVFKAISELIKESKINENKIVVNYLGNNVSSFLEQATIHNTQDICQTFGKVDREKSLQMQLSSHILLLASWNNVGDTGVITGKFLEYMMINKPIICSVMGNLPGSILKEMITIANNGVVWEQTNDELDYLVIKDYILKQYKQYEDRLPLIFAPNKEYINSFRYDKIANNFIDIIETCGYKIN